MAQITKITMENLEWFRDWLQTDAKNHSTSEEFVRNLYFDLPLSVILQDTPTLNDAAQEIIGATIARERGHKNRTQDIETLLDWAEHYPVMLGKTLFISGNNSRGMIYDAILNILQHRTFEQNIPAIYAMSQYEYVPMDKIGTGEITKTSAKNTRMLNDMFKMSETNINARNFIRFLDIDKVLNFDGASPEFRAYINKTAFNIRMNDFWNKLAKLDAKFIDEELLKYATMMDIPHPQNTARAKTQQEKNANIVPTQYAKARDALIQLVERQESHDKNNHGKLKTLTQRFKELMNRMNVNFLVRSLARDVYIKMIQRDIIDGHAAELSTDDLQIVLHGNMDKDGFYIRHVPTELLRGDLYENLNRTQRDIVSARKYENVADTVRSKRISMHDKRAAIDNMKRVIDNNAPEYEKLTAELAQYDKDYQTDIQAPYNEYLAWRTVYDSVELIQRAFNKITENLKNGTPNDRESHLATAALEHTIFGYIAGIADQTVEIPDYGGLPLFGRKTEKERRDQLNRAIRNFNETMKHVRDKSGRKYINIWSQYRGKILNPQSLSELDREQQITRDIMNDMQVQFNRTHAKRNQADIKHDIQRHETIAQRMANAQEALDGQQAALRELSKQQLGIDQDGELTAITPDMSPDTKRRTRAKNRDILKDKLAARRGKNPSHNMSELLAPNKNER